MSEIADNTITNSAPTSRAFMRHTIDLQPDWTFKVSGPEFDADEKRYSLTFKSYEAAKAEITKRVEDAEKLRAKSITLNLRAYDMNGNSIQVEKINRTTGSCAPGEYIYPQVPWVREALHRRQRLHEEFKALNKSLDEVQVRTSRSFSRIDVDDYGRKVDALREEFKAAETKARQMTEPTPIPQAVESAQ